MKMIRLLPILLLGCFMLSVSVEADAQSRREATEAYNTGAQMYRENPEGALKFLYDALEMSVDLGEEGDETRIAAEGLLPRVHLELAMNLYRERKLYETLEQLEKANETALKYGDGSTKGRVDRIIPQLYNQMGNTEYRQDNFEKAIEYYRKSIEVKADYTDPYLGIALSLEKQEDFEGMLDYLKQTIEVANQTNERAKADDALRKAKGYLLRKGDEAQRAENFQEAIVWFERVLEFDPEDPMVYYVLSINYNSLKNWKAAIENANLAIEKNNGDVEDSNIYFQLANAKQGQGVNGDACKFFGMVRTGPFKERAEYEMTHVLNCQ